MFLSKKRKTKAPIRLRGIAGWSGPVLFTNPRRQVFSCCGPYNSVFQISRFAGDLQGQSSPGFSWVLFSGDPGGTLDPKATSSQTFTLPDEEKDKVDISFLHAG